MTMTTSGATTYQVAWHAQVGRTTGDSHVTRVTVVEGYTTVDDIPRIIAVRRTGDPDHAKHIIIDSVEPASEGES